MTAVRTPRDVIGTLWSSRHDSRHRRGYIRHLIRIARRGDELRAAGHPLLDKARAE